MAARTVAELVGDAALRERAGHETWSRGTEMARRVRVSALGPLRVVASVEGGEAAAGVELTGTPGGLTWTCSAGDASAALICPHVVAVALELRRRTTPRRT